jgi:uncharacterized protein
MRLDDLDPSSNADDLGTSGGGFGGFGGGGGGGMGSLIFGLLPMLLGRRMGCWTIAIIAVVGYFVMSSGMLNLGGAGVAPQEAGQSASAGNVACDTKDELFACRVLKSTEDTWGKTFSNYPPPKLHFYNRSNQSGCGAAQAAMGPFYCPTDQGVYLDTSFFQTMQTQLGAKGDFAQAYVIAHEVGHHIQNLDGTAEKVRDAQSRTNQAGGNAYQVKMELQADCYAGVWAAKNADRIEPGDVEEGMTAANAIGDDTLMQNAGQRPVESMFTHGTSEQRMFWLRKGMQTGDPRACNTFVD